MVGLGCIYIMHLGVYLGLRCKKAENSGKAEQWRSKEAEKHKQRREKQKSKHQRSRRAKKQEHRNSNKNAQNLPKKITILKLLEGRLTSEIGQSISINVMAQTRCAVPNLKGSPFWGE